MLVRITAVEGFAAASRRRRGGLLTSAQAGAILGHFRRHLARRSKIVELTPPLTADAMLLARKHGPRAYDAVQLAAIREVDRLYRAAGLGPATLVSADRELNAAAAAEGLIGDDPSLHRPRADLDSPARFAIRSFLPDDPPALLIAGRRTTRGGPGAVDSNSARSPAPAIPSPLMTSRSGTRSP